MVGGVATRRAPVDWHRVVLLTVIGLGALWFVVGLWAIVTGNPGLVTGDAGIYRDATARWLAGEPFYYPYQLAGPYVIPSGWVAEPPILYPPVALVFLVPASLLPMALWYAIPLGVTAWMVWSYRPSLAGWALIVVCLGAPATFWSIVAGNPVVWVLMAVALSTRWRWVSAFVLLKPSVFPFALPGIRDWRWWVVVAGMVVVTLLLWPMTLDWITAVRNASGERSGVLYSLREIPMLLIPWIAWATRPAALRGPAAPRP